MPSANCSPPGAKPPPRSKPRSARGTTSKLWIASPACAKSVDRFFEEVMVMAENEAVRKNRLALLSELLREFTTVADFSEIGADERR